MRKGGLAAHGGDAERTLHTASDWIADAPVRDGLGLYLDVVRARLGIVLLILVVTVGSAAVFVAQSEKVFEAEADLLVTPIPDNNESLFGLGLVSQSGDPTRDAETLAKLITTTPVAERVRERLGSEQSAPALLENVRAEPVAQSSIVTVTARASGPERAARLANGFAQAAIAVRTERMQTLLDSVIPQLRDQLEDIPDSETASREELGRRIRTLETLRLLPDPTLHLETRATPPRSAVAPRPVLTIAAALVAALVLGFGVVLGAHVLDPRIEREDDLRRYRIPVVGRIPRQRPWRPLSQRAPLRPDQLSPAARDAFHRFASSLAARTEDGDRTIFITGTGPDLGKTTTAVNLAAALAELKEKVVLVEGDTRRPTLASTLQVAPRVEIARVLAGRALLTDALVEAEGLPGRIQVLARNPEEATVVPISAEGADMLMLEAIRRQSWLIIDGAALNYAPDSLPLAKRVESVLLVVHLRKTRVRDLVDLAELLTHQGIVPAGFVLIGEKPRPVYH